MFIVAALALITNKECSFSRSCFRQSTRGSSHTPPHRHSTESSTWDPYAHLTSASLATQSCPGSTRTHCPRIGSPSLSPIWRAPKSPRPLLSCTRPVTSPPCTQMRYGTGSDILAPDGQVDRDVEEGRLHTPLKGGTASRAQSITRCCVSV